MDDATQHLWFEDGGGTGRPLLLLHPGGTDSRAFGLLAPHLDGYRLIAPDQRAHGRTRDPGGALSFAAMADDTAEIVRDLGLGPIDVLGYSDGAVVGLTLAERHPDLVASLVFACGVFHHEGWHEGVLAEAPPEFMGDSYGEVSPHGRAHWDVVVAKLDDLHAREPAYTTADLARLGTPVLIVVGDDDEVRLEHALAMYEAVPDAELAVLPRATHGLMVEKPDLFARLVCDFHAPGKTNGVAALRRDG